MIYRDIQDTRIPALGFGTWELTPRNVAREVVSDALAVGYRHLDTAQAYDNEEGVGRGIADSGVSREEIFLTTKVWRDHLRYDETIASTEESLRRLRTDYVDLLLIHWPNEDLPFAEPLAAMQALQAQGKIRHVGVSNFAPSQLTRAMALVPVFCNQVEYHPYLGQPALRAMAQEHDLLLTAYCPLMRGRVMEDATLKEIGAGRGKTPVQVTLRWHLQQENVASIPKASSAEHRRENFDIFDFELTEDEMQAIFALDRGERIIDPAFAPQWDR